MGFGVFVWASRLGGVLSGSVLIKSAINRGFDFWSLKRIIRVISSEPSEDAFILKKLRRLALAGRLSRGMG